MTAPYTPLYQTLNNASAARNEHNDCAVIAFAVCTGIDDYELSRNIIHDAGIRKPRSGTNAMRYLQLFGEYGFDLIEIEPPGKTVRTLERNLDCPEPMLMMTSGKRHVAAVRSRVVHDHTRGSLTRINRMWRVQPCADTARPVIQLYGRNIATEEH